MKTFIASGLLLFFYTFSFAQNAWQDAVKLNEYFEFDPARFRVEVDNSTEVDELAIMDIVAKYCPQAIVETSSGMRVNVDSCFEGNPFISLHQYAQSRFSTALSEVLPGKEEGTVGTSQGGISGGSLITNLADGLAIFLVKRTKEELNAAFFEGLRKKMEEQPAYRALFPATYDLLYVIGSEIYNYNAYLETLREGFRADLKVLPMSFRQFSLDHQFVKKPEFQIAVEDLLYTSQMIFEAEKPSNILRFLAGAAAMQDSLRWQDIPNPKTRHAMQDMAMSIRALHLFTESMTQEVGKTVWVSSEEVSRQMRDISHTYLYLGLLWQQGKGIRFSNGNDFRGALGRLEKMNQTPISLRNYLVSLAQTGQLLEKDFQVLLAKSDTAAFLNEEYRQFAGQVFELLDQARQFRQVVVLPDWKVENGKPIESENENEKANETDTLEHKTFTVLRHLFDMDFNIRQERFTLAVTNLTRLLTELLNSDDFKFKKEFLRHVNFMATVAEARNSREVAAAIELFALPPGSSRMKKQSAWSVSLNSYGGIAYGWENDLNEEVDAALKEKNVVSTYAPVGVDFNIGLGDAGSLSFYTQLVDVGAIFAYRFSNETSQIPELKFQNIVAPGFYGIYGFGNNIPVSLGVGAQLGPNLRKIDEDLGLDIETTNAWRFGFLLSVDIPITHFYTN